MQPDNRKNQEQRPSTPVPIRTVPLSSEESINTKPSVKVHAVRHFSLFKKHTAKTSKRVKRGYHKADSALLWSAKRALPRSTKERLAANRERNNGNLRFYVPVAYKITPKQLPITIPAGIRYARHGILPIALIAVIVFLILPTNAAPSYVSTKTIGGNGADEARKIVVDSAGNTYAAGTFTGAVDFKASWTDASTTLFADNFDDGELSGWSITGDAAVNDGQSVSNDYSLQSNSASQAAYAETNITPSTDITIRAQVRFASADQDIDFFLAWTDAHPFTLYRQTGTNALCVYNGHAGSPECSAGGVLPQDTWLDISLTVQSGALDGKMIARVNGSQIIDYTGNIGTGLFERVNLGNTLNRSGVTYFDDIAISSTDTAHSSKSSNTSSQDIFITKINTDGSYAWTKQFGGSGIDTLHDLTLDDNDNVYLAGSFENTVDFGDDWGVEDEKISTGETDGFITRIGSDGLYDFSRRVGGSGSDVASAVAVDRFGMINVGGWFEDGTIFDDDGGLANDIRISAGGTDGFLMQFDESGNWAWSKQFGDITNDYVTAAEMGDLDIVHLAGTFTGEVNFAESSFGEDIHTSEGGTDVFITKIDGGGGYISTNTIGGTDAEAVSDIAIDGSNNLYIVGKFASTNLNFAASWGDTQTKSSTGLFDGFITKIDGSNTHEWTHTVGGTDIDGINTVGFRETGDVYIGGNFASTTLDFGDDWGEDDTKTNGGQTDAFVSLLDTSGAYYWTATIGGSDNEQLHDIAVDDTTVHVVGSFDGTTNFGSGLAANDEQTSVGSTDAFVMTIGEGDDTYTITDADGLTFKDENGVNLSSDGTSNPTPAVHVIDEDNDLLLAIIGANLSENRDWSEASGDSSLPERTMFLSGVLGADGAAPYLTLYVPRDASDKAVVLCPGVSTLEAVETTCVNRITLTTSDTNVDTVTIGGVDYWEISDVNNTAIGAMSLAFPGLVFDETDGSTAVIEGGATDYVSVVLSAQPSEDVTVTITPSINDRLSSITPLTFTSANWDEEQLVLLQSIDNNSIASESSFTLSYATDSSDTNFDEISETAVITVGWTDNDSAGVIWTGTDSLTSESGDTASVCVALTALPSADVVVQLSSSDTGEVMLADGTITISPEDWDADDNCVLATGQGDDLTDGAQEVDITVTGISSEDEHFDGIDVGDIDPFVITNQDNDTASIAIFTSVSIETTEAGGTAEICAFLSARPVSGSVTIPLSVSDGTEASLGASSLVIAAANWDEDDNCVTITGEDDDIDDGDISYDVITGDPTATDPAWDALTADSVASPTFTNIDDDTAEVVISQSGGTTAVVEDGANDTINVVLATQPAEDRIVVINVQPNGQISIGEGAGIASNLTFTEEDWNTPQQVTVSADDDTSVEGAHQGTVIFTVHEDTTELPYQGLDPEAIDINITDNDVAVASIATTSDTTEGSDEPGVFTVSLDAQNNTGGDIVLNYSVAGTAVADTHYQTLSGSLAIANGQSATEVHVDTESYANDLLEGSKTVVVTVTSSASSSAEVSESADNATVVIFDDETATASLSKTEDGDEEGPMAVEYTVTLSRTNNTGAPISFDISPQGGTAVVGDDYANFASSSIVVADGQASGTFEVTVIDDSVFEPETETLTAEITDPSFAAVSILGSTAEAAITDNETAELSILASDATAAENPANPGEFTISLDKINNTGEDVTVSYEVGGTASEGNDYDALSGEAVIPSGQNTATIAVETAGHDDDQQEGSETVVVTIVSTDFGPRVTIGEDSSAAVTITDDEGAGITATVADDTTSEAGDTGEICFTLTSQPSGNVSIALSSSDSSMVTVQNSITINSGDWDANDNCVTVTGQDDNPPLATGTQEVTILTGDVTSTDDFYDALVGNDVEDITIYHADNDTASIEVQVVDDTTSESGDAATIRFRLTSRPSDTVTIPVASSDLTEGTLNGVMNIAIEPDHWNNYAANELTIEGVDDELTDGDIEYELLTGNPTSDDEAYDSLGTDDTTNPTLTNIDDDEASITILASGGTTEVTEGGATDTHAVQISTQPSPGNQVVITATPTNSQINVGAGAGSAVDIIFDTNDWADPKTVTITATDDSILEATHSSGVAYSVHTEETTEQVYKDYSDPLPTLPVTITDNDTANANLTASGGNEEGPIDATFTVTLDKTNNTGSPITFSLNPDGGTATISDDYANFSGTTLSVANGSNTATHDVVIIDDELLEANEIIEAVLSNSSLGAVAIGDPSASATITDNDTAAVSIVANDAAAAENPSNNGEFTVSISKTNNTGSDIIADYSIGGTATADADYTTLSGSITIGSGTSSATITVDTSDKDDKLTEGNETVIVSLDDTNHPRVSIGDPDQATVTIADDDEPSVTITATGGNTSVSEAGTTDTQTVEIGTQPAPGNEVVIVATPSNGQLNLGSGDGNPTTLTFTHENWEDAQEITVSAVDDDLLESDHESTVAYSMDTNNTTESAYDSYGPLPQLSVSITDNDTAEANLSADNGTEASSDDATFTVTLDKTNNTGSPITFSLDPDGGTATVTADYTNFSATTLSVANGSNTASHGVGIVDDSLLENDETIEAALSNSSLGTVTINTAVATATITDNDTAEATITATDAEAAENPSNNGAFTIGLDKVNYTGTSITVNYSVSGSATANQDYAALSGSVSIANNESSATVSVNTAGLDDKLIEDDETVIVTLDSTSHGRVSIGDPDQATVTIADDDEPSVTVTASSGTTNITEGGASDTQTVVIGTQPAPGNEVVIVATPENSQLDLGEGAGNAIELTFTNANWDDAQTVTVSAIDDDLLESNHTSSLTYSIDTGSTSESPYDSYGPLPQLSVSITDNDTAEANLSADNGSETDSDATSFTVTISKANNTGAPITFTLEPSGGSAVTGDDYVNFANTTLSIANGESSAQYELDVIDDSLLENDETVEAIISDVSLGAISIDQATATATIADNDTAEASITATDSAAAENPSDNGEFTVTISKANNTGSDIIINYSVSGSATANADYATISGNATILNDASSATISVNTAAYDDKLIEEDETIVATLENTNHARVSIGDPDQATVTIADDDEPSVTITTTGGSTSVTEGGSTDTQTVEIGTQPAPGNEVVIVATPENTQLDLGEGAGNARKLTFTNENWEDAQEVTVSAVDDDLLESDHSALVRYSIDTADTTESAYDSYGPLPELLVSVMDNDTATADISSTDGSEAGPDDINFTITLSKTNNTGSPITFGLSPSGGTATAIDDYSNFSGTTVSVANGSTIAVVNVSVIDDSLLEDDETVVGEISNPSLGIVTIGTNISSATITDNDETVVNIVATQSTAYEDESSDGLFTINLGKVNYTGSTITVNYNISGTASPGADYVTLSGTADIVNGGYAATVTVDVSGMNDDSVEGNETVIVTLDTTSHDRVTVGNPNQASVTIVDDDTPSIAVLASGGSTNISESGTTDTQSVQIGTQPAPGTQVVIRATPTNGQISLGGNPGEALDLVFTDQNWTEAQIVTVAADDDDLLESSHSSSVAYTINTDDTTDADYLGYEITLPTLSVSIADNDTASADLSAVAGSETGPADIEFTVTLSKTNHTGSPITVALNPSGGTATITNDYANFTNTTLSIAPNTSSATAYVGVIDDSLLEGTETVSGSLSSPSLGIVTIGSATSLTDIIDNDETSATIVATDPNAAENPSDNGEFTIYLDRINNTDSDIIVSYDVTGSATPGNDYTALSGSAIIAPGDSTASLVADTNNYDDDSVEGNETVIVTLLSTDHPLVDTGSPDSATVTIADDDGFTMNIATTQDGDEDGPTNITYTVSLSNLNDTGQPITFTLSDDDGTATSGDDYQPFGGVISIPDGAQSVVHTITVIDDDDLEGTESVGATISNPSQGVLGIATATATITDNDAAVATITASDPSAAENPSDNGTFQINLDKTNHRSSAIEFTYSVNGSATGGEDYATLSGHAMITSGQSDTTIVIDTDGYNDEVFEGDESVLITLTSTSVGVVTVGNPNQATVIITDDDPEPKDPNVTPPPSANTDRTPARTVYVPTNPQTPADMPTPLPVEPALQPVDQRKKDLDNDGIPDEEEEKAHNGGDGNGDGIPDAKQKNVASLISSVTSKSVTLEVLGECKKIQSFAVVPEDSLKSQDKRFRYSQGLVDYTLRCEKPGQQAQVTIYYDHEVKDIGFWRKLNAKEQRFNTLYEAQHGTKSMGNATVSTVKNSIQDGGEHDDDGMANKQITDPAGPAQRTFYFLDGAWFLAGIIGLFLVVAGVRYAYHKFKP